MLIELTLLAGAAWWGVRRLRGAPPEPAPEEPDLRQAQIDEISSVEDTESRRAAERALDREIVGSFASLGLATAGVLVYWPIGLLGLYGPIKLGWPGYRETFEQLRRGQLTTHALSSMTTIGCVVTGHLVVANIIESSFLISKRLLLKVTDDARGDLLDITRGLPATVWLLTDGGEVEVPLTEVEPGQTITVGPGEVVPIDGLIIDGLASIDQHVLTGESSPVDKAVGDAVYASTIVLVGRIAVRVQCSGEGTTVARIGRILNEAAEARTRMQLRVQDIADRTVAPTLIAGGAVLPLLGPIGALALVNAHFKHKMSFIAPIGLMRYLGEASRGGILVKDGRALDQLSRVDTIVFDKTGTLTDERPVVGEIHPMPGRQPDHILAVAAAVEGRQAHPLARAIVEAAEARGIELPSVADTACHVGFGVEGTLDGRSVLVGSRRLIERGGADIPAEMQQVLDRCRDDGHTAVLVCEAERVIGAIEFLPTVREEAAEVVAALRARPGIDRIYIISGDSAAATHTLAGRLGIEHVFAEVLPEDKADLVDRLGAEGRTVCFVGDGINDAIALQKAAVAISLRGASTIATDVAQVVLMDGDLTGLPAVFRLADGFADSMRSTFGLVLLPAAVGVGGVLLLHFGLVHTIVLNLVGLGAGVAHSALAQVPDVASGETSDRPVTQTPEKRP